MDNGEGGTPDITFDLGEEFPLTKARIWNHNERLDRAVQDVDISFSTDGTTFSGHFSTTFPQPPGTDGYTGFDLEFDSPITARYVKFDVQSNYRTLDLLA